MKRLQDGTMKIAKGQDILDQSLRYRHAKTAATSPKILLAGGDILRMPVHVIFLQEGCSACASQLVGTRP